MRALIVIDVQSDFMPGGALAVAGGDEVVPAIHRLQAAGGYGLIVATQDWHPAGHASFGSSHGLPPGELIDLDGLQQVLWPDHCVQGTPGAGFFEAWDDGPVEAVFRKGTSPRIDSYSGFHDNGHRKTTGMAAFLRGRGVTAVDVCGVATDYCVRFTALDALAEGFAVRLVLDACRGVDLSPGDIDAAIAELAKAGVEIVVADEVCDTSEHR